MSAFLQQGCVVMDTDGFMMGGRYRVREIGFTSLTTSLCLSYRLNLIPFFNEMTDKESKLATYCRFQVHGLTIRPMRHETFCFDAEDLEGIVRYVYQKCRTDTCPVVLYKGGNKEVRILNQFNIPHFNIERVGCPKFCDLPTPAIQDCGYHKPLPSVHCPKVETFAFAEWVKTQLTRC